MTALNHQLFDLIAANPGRRLPFSTVMELALYHPQWGYYGPGPRRIGRDGDFYTAVSTGPLYGQLLAGFARDEWLKRGQPKNFILIEQAAHDGQLAEDILSALPTEFKPARYFIIEPNRAYQKVQKERLSPWGDTVAWVENLSELPACPAFFLSNELPDAMPVHLIRRRAGEWMELYVQGDKDRGLEFVEGPLSNPALKTEVARLPENLPDGYTTEVGLAALSWITEVVRSPISGTVFIADYGFDADELYSPERTEGTLRRYYQHRTDDRVLENLGECDLTAHVNFTRLGQVAEENGMQVRTYEHQGRFLGKLGLPWLASLEGRVPDAATKALLRQYQSLTHPAFMGRSFRVMVLDKLG